MLATMLTTPLQDCTLLFPSADAPPRSIVIVGATGQVGFGKLCQIADRLVPSADLEIPIIALDPSNAISTIKTKLEQRLSKRHSGTQLQSLLAKLSCIQGTAKDLPEQLEIGWALEAVPEQLATKKSVYQALLSRDKTPALLASTTSAYTSQTLFGEYPNNACCAVMHPFFPHHKNPLWEVASTQAVSSPDTLDKIRVLLQALNLEAIEVADVPAFAADRVFCGLMLHAVKSCEAFNLAPQAFDEISQELIGCAPFRVHNMIPGSNALSMHCMELCYQEQASSLFEIPDRWKVYQNNPTRTWPMDSGITPDAEQKKLIRERILGALACICAYLLKHKIVAPADLDRLCTEALAFRQGPCTLFQELGIPEVQKAAQAFITKAKITHADRVAPLEALSLLGE